jgi:hypothetical protein
LCTCVVLEQSICSWGSIAFEDRFFIECWQKIRPETCWRQNAQ